MKSTIGMTEEEKIDIKVYFCTLAYDDIEVIIYML